MRAQRAALTTESARIAARYVALIDEANDALVVLDEGGRVVEANRRASELLREKPATSSLRHERARLPAAQQSAARPTGVWPRC